MFDCFGFSSFRTYKLQHILLFGQIQSSHTVNPSTLSSVHTTVHYAAYNGRLFTEKTYFIAQMVKSTA